LLAYTIFPMYLAQGESSERIFSVFASGNFFDVLGVPAAHGRIFQPSDDAGDGRPVAVISHGLWQRQFGGRPDVVGKNISLNGHPFTVVGITPPEFRGTIPGLLFDAWLPIANQDRLMGERVSQDRTLRFLSVIGRLKSGVQLPQAEARLNLVAEDLARTYPQTNANLKVSIYPPWRSPRGAPALLGSLMIVLMGVMGLLLVITCANVANLLLSRAVVRQRDVAIRLALGASRLRLMRQLIVESLELALLSGVVGLFVAYWTATWLGGFIPPTEIPVDREVRLEWGVLTFALVITAASGLLFGLVPALQTTRPALIASLKDDAAGSVGGAHRSRLRNGLVIVQIALSLVLLVAAGLFLRSLLNVQAVETGFNPRNVLLTTLFMPRPGYDAARGTRFYEDMLQRIEQLPDVRSASLSRRVPLGLGGFPSSEFVVEGYTPRSGERPWSYVNVVAPRFFRALDVQLLSGRDFAFEDNDRSGRVAIINDVVASQYFQRRDAIGSRIQFEGEWRTIVGVVRSFKIRQVNEPPTPIVFLPLMQLYRSDTTLLVRTASDPARMAPAIRRIIKEMDVEIPLVAVRTLERHIETATFPQRASASFLSLFGVLALMLAAIGIYGVMAYSVAQRTRELGIRMALGAQRVDILRLLLKEGALLIAIGAALGIAGAIGISRVLGQFLIGVDPRDGMTFFGVTVVLCAMALLACYLPARRAMRVDPVVALRHE
ncbi:MAG: ABC transporter permease, partial [Acidobacteria bacterium]|nr:ABC transporter permease [Acidobacteriota bacterium]